MIEKENIISPLIEKLEIDIDIRNNLINNSILTDNMNFKSILLIYLPAKLRQYESNEWNLEHLKEIYITIFSNIEKHYFNIQFLYISIDLTCMILHMKPEKTGVINMTPIIECEDKLKYSCGCDECSTSRSQLFMKFGS